jgi:asparagine synthase (glutamine-hydrolysing)
MCGITGYWDFNQKLSTEASIANIKTMTSALKHRGPDNYGLWYDAPSGIYLGHRRLSIYDLSANAKQPMVSASTRYTMVFNGSIYNHHELRQNLTNAINPSWKSSSDTEVILTGFEHWGIEGTINKLVGMFAIALWDQQDKTFHLIRDRLGEKPLYYGIIKDILVFGSELKAIKAMSDIDLEISHHACAYQLQYSYIPAPLSIYKNINKLEPGRIASINKDKNITIKQYWSLRDCMKQPQSTCNRHDALSEFRTLFGKVIDNQVKADVPVGAFLSGGTDSTTVVSFLKNKHQNVHTFSIGIDDSSYNEAENAKNIARQLGTTHHELYVSEQDALDLIPSLPHMYDEPFSDSSQIPTALVAKMAKQHVTVALSGDGADELFAGYNRHRLLPSLAKHSTKSRFIKDVIGNALLAIPTTFFDAMYEPLHHLHPRKFNHQAVGDKAHKMGHLLQCTNIQSMYEYTTTHWLPPPMHSLNKKIQQPLKATIINDNLNFILANDTLGYLPGDILTKVDRASMYFALETRIPFLDHRLVEFSWRLSNSLKINNGTSKYLLKKHLEDYIDKKYIYQPKKGFGIPIDKWLCGSLKEWAEDLLSKQSLAQYPFLNDKAIRVVWKLYKKKHGNTQYLIWDILMLVSWLNTSR